MLKLYQRGEEPKDNGTIPDPIDGLFQTPKYGQEEPIEVFGWQWSCDFGRWSALVLFADGWLGFAYPITKD